MEAPDKTAGQTTAEPAAVAQDETPASQKEDGTGILTKVYRFETLIGVQAMRYGKRFFTRLRRAALKPAGLLKVLLRLLFLTADKLLLRYFTAFRREARMLRLDVRGALRGMKGSSNRHFLTLASIARHYTVKALTRHKKFFKTVFNTALPAGALAALLLVIAYYSNAGFALRVTLNEKQVSYVKTDRRQQRPGNALGG